MIDRLTQRYLWLSIFGLGAVLWLAAPLPAAHTVVRNLLAATDVDSGEVDLWRGASIGVRIEMEDDIPVVSSVHSHFAGSSPFLENDRMISLGALRFPGSSLDDIGNLLEATSPGAELPATVLRGDTEIRLNVTMMRRECVDIPAIVRKLRTNRIIKQHLESSGRGGLLDDIDTRMVKAVQESQSPRQAVEAINQIIGEIGVSHTAILPASSNLQSNSKSKGELGLVLQRFRLNDRHGYFIIDLKPGAPAANSELKLGDEILSLNGVAIERSRRLDISGHEGWYDLFGIEAEPGEVLTIEYLRSPFDDSQIAEIESVAEIGPVESLQASARLIAVGERQVGYLRFWNLMSVSVNGYLAKAIRTEFAECDALILDLRGRGGVVPAVTSINRTVQKIDVPVVVIIDGLTRSAKEMLAFLLKKQDHVVLIGTRTAGAVIGASMVPLPSGNALMLPVASVETLKRFVDGEVLEGVGVEPDEEVDYFPPYSAGIDRMLQAALSRAAELAGCRVDAK